MPSKSITNLSGTVLILICIGYAISKLPKLLFHWRNITQKINYSYFKIAQLQRRMNKSLLILHKYNETLRECDLSINKNEMVYEHNLISYIRQKIPHEALEYLVVDDTIDLDKFLQKNLKDGVTDSLLFKIHRNVKIEIFYNARLQKALEKHVIDIIYYRQVLIQGKNPDSVSSVLSRDDNKITTRNLTKLGNSAIISRNHLLQLFLLYCDDLCDGVECCNELFHPIRRTYFCH